MTDSHPLIKDLTDKLLKEVVQHVLEVSVEQYQIVCNSILKYAIASDTNVYSSEFIDAYKEYLENRFAHGEVCKEYRRFQHRVLRMLSSLAETGAVDFSSTAYAVKKYPVSSEIADLVEKILGSYPISDATKSDLRAPTRHFLWYASEQGMDPEHIDDVTVMKFIINEIPVSNSGSTGRTLRCIKYSTEYLKSHGNQHLHRDYRLLKLRNDHRRIIPAYTEEEISDIADVANRNDMISKRDLAIILLAYCTGLRGCDIIRIKLTDIDWQNDKLSLIQSKNHQPLSVELNGSTMNALADYILDWRPECNDHEVFVTVKSPYRKLSKGFGSMIDKYCERAGVEKISLRGFHSIRRAFETIMVSRGVPIDIASQMMGHKSIVEDKPYITHNKSQIAFVAFDFMDVPITTGFYAKHKNSSSCNTKGGA
ncbi:Site-specific recombinase XerD [Butyrivibrio fibrisolvens DSM 3071]|uniref:Site-specific recombinase XerD n=1 Tax=Butyrivibrio fibrisolvens DSM 3071 TaxID=1121131 RepID=A0A1M6GPV6_BUTFI|nr:site-specific integrase [Butyrivibrio fibrisolvens]SHJ11981.1 Site-specific recombinase XerD [Butyrivibrio fibrisolvens DSM 3071]